jgi:hypothetical protein
LLRRSGYAKAKWDKGSKKGLFQQPITYCKFLLY